MTRRALRDTSLYLTLAVFGIFLWLLSCTSVQAQDRVIAGFTACGTKECRYLELEAPSLMACQLGQGPISQWLRENGMGSWKLQNGWKCYINMTMRGPGIPA